MIDFPSIVSAAKAKRWLDSSAGAQEIKAAFDALQAELEDQIASRMDETRATLLEHFDDHGDTVMFAPGGGFYATPGKGINEIRIAYVLKQADLERAMDLLALGIQAYNNR